MRGLTVWVSGLVLCCGLGGLAVAQQGAAKGDATHGGLKPLFSFGKKTPDKKAEPAHVTSRAPAAVDSEAAVRARELAAWHRRSAVCLRLQEVFAAGNNEQLQREVELLEKLAFDLYLRRTTQLGGAGEELPMDEGIFELRLGQTAAGGASLTAQRAGGAPEGSRRAEVKEKKR